MKKQQSIRAACLAIAVCSVGLLTVSCASVGNSQKNAVEPDLQAPLTLTESVLIANGNDLKRLFNAWIAPVAEPAISSANKNAIADGFSRFCSLNGGRLLHEEGQYGDDYRCEKPDTTFIGSMSTTRTQTFGGAKKWLAVSYETPQTLKERNERLKNLEERRARNGPTGWVVTKEGKFRFIRLGGSKGRQVIEVGQIPVDDIASLTWNGTDVHVKLWNGSTQAMNAGQIMQRTQSERIAYGLDYPLPILILDQKSGRRYINLYANASGIRSIQFDPVEKWVRLPNNVIEIDMRSPRYEAQLASLGNLYKQFNKTCEAAEASSEMIDACHAARSTSDEIARITKLQAEFEGYRSPR